MIGEYFIAGINNGVTTALSTVLNEIIHPFFPVS